MPVTRVRELDLGRVGMQVEVEFWAAVRISGALGPVSARREEGGWLEWDFSVWGEGEGIPWTSRPCQLFAVENW